MRQKLFSGDGSFRDACRNIGCSFALQFLRCVPQFAVAVVVVNDRAIAHRISKMFE